MISQNGQNGNGTVAGDAVPEATSNVRGRNNRRWTVDCIATRTRQRARQQFQQNKFVVIGAGAGGAALLLFVALSVPHKHSVQKPKGTVAGQQDPTQPSESSSVEPSLLPITDSGRPPTKATHEGFFDEQDLQRTATRQRFSQIRAAVTEHPVRNVSFGTTVS